MKLVEVGYVARAHGVRGELRVHLHDPASQALYAAERVWIGGEEHEVERVRPTTGAVLLTVSGVRGRDAAEALRGRPVAIPREAVPLAPGEFLVSDLVGCEVVDTEGRPLGRAVRVLPGAAQDVLVIHGAVETLLPIVPEFIVEVDAGARRVVVAPPEGLPTEPL